MCCVQSVIFIFSLCSTSSVAKSLPVQMPEELAASERSMAAEQAEEQAVLEAVLLDGPGSPMKPMPCEEPAVVEELAAHPQQQTEILPLK